MEKQVRNDSTRSLGVRDWLRATRGMTITMHGESGATTLISSQPKLVGIRDRTAEPLAKKR